MLVITNITIFYFVCDIFVIFDIIIDAIVVIAAIFIIFSPDNTHARHWYTTARYGKKKQARNYDVTKNALFRALYYVDNDVVAAIPRSSRPRYCCCARIPDAVFHFAKHGTVPRCLFF